MEIGQEYRQTQTQRGVMTPAIQQSLAILQMPLTELEAHLSQQLLENCVLERLDECMEPAAVDRAAPESDTPRDDEDPPDLGWMELFSDGRDLGEPLASGRKDTGSGRASDPAAPRPSLTEHLLSQLGVSLTDAETGRIAALLIGEIDGNGYLRSTVAEMAAAFGVKSRVVADALRLIQTFEPAGVGARDLRECLLLQLEADNGLAHRADDVELRTLAAAIVRNHLQELAANNHASISKALGSPRERVRAAIDVIRMLDPKPGRNFGPHEPPYVLPDLTVKQCGGEYSILVNEGLSGLLRVNPYYRRIATGALTADPETVGFIRDRYSAACRLLKCIEGRKRTLLRVAEAVFRRQKDFLDGGSKHLRPMNLQEVAADVGLHESTVSRAIAGKYVDTPRGVYGMRYFFDTRLGARNGGEVSAESVKRVLKEKVLHEDPGSRLSDQRLVELLREAGIDISRRTVAKYRKELSIPSLSARTKR